MMLGKLQGVIMGIAVIIFGIFWTMMASNIGAPGFFSIFGIFFIILAVIFLLRVLFGPGPIR